MKLSPQQIEQFHRDGYTTMHGVLTPAEVAAACDDISRIIREKLVPLDIEPALKDKAEALHDPELAVRKIMTFTEHGPALKAIAQHPAIVGAVEELVGESVEVLQEMALLKPPHVGREKPWHQDNAYFKLGPPEKVAGVWIALDKATAENGCMQVVPGTHRRGPVAHFHIRDCQIPDDRVEVSRRVCVPLEPGSLMIFSGLLHHGTPDNNSPSRRRALQYHYAAKSCVKLTPEEHAQMFHEGDRYAGCGVWPREVAEKIVVRVKNG